MNRKPSDLLEFLRSSPSGEAAEPSPDAQEPEARRAPAPPSSEPHLEKTPRMVVLRRSQVVVASVAVAFGIILAFLLGLAAASPGDSLPAAIGARVWGLRIITYNDTESGRRQALATKKALQARKLEEVTLQRVPSRGEIVVMLGAWLTDPTDDLGQRELLATVKKLQQGGKIAFPDAYLWSIQR